MPVIEVGYVSVDYRQVYAAVEFRLNRNDAPSGRYYPWIRPILYRN
jgi:hypothetical protein